MDHWVFVGVTNRNIGDGYLWEQKWFKSSCITEKPNPTGTMTDESWNPGALCTTCTQLDSLEISSLEFSWSESLPTGRETTGDCCCSPRHTIFSLLLSLLGLPIPCWGDIWILRKLLNTSKKNLAEARQCVAARIPYMELSSGLSKKMWRKSLRCSRNPKTSEIPDVWGVHQGNLRALNETSPERRHRCYRQLSWKARAT